MNWKRAYIFSKTINLELKHSLKQRLHFLQEVAFTCLDGPETHQEVSALPCLP